MDDDDYRNFHMLNLVKGLYKNKNQYELDRIIRIINKNPFLISQINLIDDADPFERVPLIESIKEIISRELEQIKSLEKSRPPSPSSPPPSSPPKISPEDVDILLYSIFYELDYKTILQLTICLLKKLGKSPTSPTSPTSSISSTSFTSSHLSFLFSSEE